MILAFKKHISQPWHRKSPFKRVYENRGKYFRKIKTPVRSFMLRK